MLILTIELFHYHNRIGRSNHRRCSVRKGVLRNFAKFIGKHLAQVFSYEFCEISKNKFFTEYLWATTSGWARLFHSELNYLLSNFFKWSLKCSSYSMKVPLYAQLFSFGVSFFCFTLTSDQRRILRRKRTPKKV